jgi:hypothetical protein
MNTRSKTPKGGMGKHESMPDKKEPSEGVLKSEGDEVLSDSESGSTNPSPMERKDQESEVDRMAKAIQEFLPSQ